MGFNIGNWSILYWAMGHITFREHEMRIIEIEKIIETVCQSNFTQSFIESQILYGEHSYGQLILMSVIQSEIDLEIIARFMR